MNVKLACLGATTAVLAAPALAQDTGQPNRAIGMDISYSSDADDTEVTRLGANFDWRYRSPEEYQGLRIERIWFDADGQSSKSNDRLYLRWADSFRDLKFVINAGTDGHTIVGSVAIHNEAPLRQEVFIERDKIETPLGFRRGLYSTFIGSAIDVPLGSRSQLTLLGGLQDYSGSNLRTHLRANLIHVLKRDWGLSAQLRTRYFHNSHPGEYDYFSPRRYGEILPVLQVRRFQGGWRYLAAAGWGVQRDSNARVIGFRNVNGFIVSVEAKSRWRESRYLNFRVTSPGTTKGWAVAGDFVYSNTPITDGDTYDYARVTVGLTRIF